MALREITELPCPPGLPMLGNARQIQPTRLHALLEGWARDYGRLFRFKLLRENVLVVNDHQLLSELLRDRPEGLGRSKALRLTADELGAQGVFSAEGERWRTHRKLVMRALAPEVVRHFYPTMERMTQRLLDRWNRALAEGRPVDVARDLKAWAMDITIALSFGEDIDALDHDDDPLQKDVELMFRMVGRRMILPVRYWNWLKLPIDREADRMVERIDQRVRGFIADARARMAAQPALRDKPSNMLEAMVVARDEPDSGFTDEDIIGNTTTLVFAGEDTAANTLGWLLYFLSTHPEQAATARAEVDRLLGDHRVAPDFACLQEMDYVEAAANEAMRIKPVAPLAGFEVFKERVVGDVRVPVGTRIFGLMRAAALDEAHFVDAHRFDPLRWLQQQAGQPATQQGAPNASPQATAAIDSPARKVFPFGAGPRLCPGRYLAIAEIRIAASMILRNFDLSFDDDPASIEEVFALTMTPDRLPVRLHPRP